MHIRSPAPTLGGCHTLGSVTQPNDLPMFAIAAIAVGVANADAAVRAAGVQLTSAASGLGIAEALHRHLPRPDRSGNAGY